MQYYRLSDNKITKAAFGVFLFLLLLLARDTLITSCLVGVRKAQFLSLGLIVIGGLVFLAANLKRVGALLTDRRMLAVVLSTLILLFPMVAKRDWQFMYFSVLLCLYFAIFLTYFISYKEVARYYVVILCILGVYSVIATYLLRILPDSGTFPVKTFVNSMGREFYDFGLAFVSIVEVKGRNFGIFREPGVYQFFLILGLYLNNYVIEWEKNRPMWIVNGILAVTMMSTFATGGVIEMGLLAVVMFFEKGWYQNKRARLIAAALVAAAMLMVAIAFWKGGSLAYELRGMVEKLFTDSDSTSSRVEAIFTDIEIFFRAPLWGDALAYVLHMVEHNTTSSLLLFAGFGIMTGGLNVLAWVALVWDKERKLWANLALLVVLFMSFNTQNLITDIFFWLFPYMALVERGIPLCEKVKK